MPSSQSTSTHTASISMKTYGYCGRKRITGWRLWKLSLLFLKKTSIRHAYQRAAWWSRTKSPICDYDPASHNPLVPYTKRSLIPLPRELILCIFFFLLAYLASYTVQWTWLSLSRYLYFLFQLFRTFTSWLEYYDASCKKVAMQLSKNC